MFYFIEYLTYMKKQNAIPRKLGKTDTDRLQTRALSVRSAMKDKAEFLRSALMVWKHGAPEM